jgi:hypothetical protein
MVAPKITNAQKPFPWKIIIPVVIIVIVCCLCLVGISILGYLGIKGTGPLSMLATATPTRTPTLTPTPTATATPRPTATATPLTLDTLIPGQWDLYYSWDCSSYNSSPDYLNFSTDGSFSLIHGSDSSYDYTGKWSVYGYTLDFIFDGENPAHYTGTVSNGYSYVEGKMETSTGSNGCWHANKK